MVESTSVREKRAQLDAIPDRAQADASFGERLNKEPEATLREAGLHSRAVNEVSREIKELLPAGSLVQRFGSFTGPTLMLLPDGSLASALTWPANTVPR